jgi:hypothetical protein
MKAREHQLKTEIILLIITTKIIIIKYLKTTREVLSRFCTEDSRTRNNACNRKSIIILNLKPRRWGPQPVQEKKYHVETIW